MFIGRKKELEEIKNILGKDSGAVLVYGKRKVGKTTLLKEACKLSKDPFIYYECLKAPLEENVMGLIDCFVSSGIFPPGISFPSFIELFSYLSSLPGNYNVVIDEYPYLKKDGDGERIDSMFQKLIDQGLKNTRLFLSGSEISMMKDLLEEKNALYGRFSLVLPLRELDYLEASSFYPDKTPYEKIGFYSVFGGSPFVNAQIDPSLDLRGNIERLLLSHYSSVYSYSDNLLLSDLSNSFGAERVFSCLGNGKKKYGEIESSLRMKNNGLLSKRLSGLLSMELLRKTYPINKQDDQKKSFYEINDNLLRFYYAYVYRNKSHLEMLGASSFYESYIEPSLIDFVSRRFEEIGRNYFSLKAKKGDLKGVKAIGSYYYDDPVEKENGEFDIALERGSSYDVYEAKYLRHPLSRKIMDEEILKMKRIKGLKIGKIGFLSVNGFKEKIDGIEYIDGSDLYDI